MDPELMADICLCPYCHEWAPEGGFFPCKHCEPYGGMGYVPCDLIAEGEPKETMLEQRSKIVVTLTSLDAPVDQNKAP